MQVPSLLFNHPAQIINRLSEVTYLMDAAFVNWLKHHKLEAYVSTFNEAGYLSGADSGLAVLR